MLRHFALSMGLLLSSMLLSGCSYDRSFMQMDSNSGVPFFGLQWADDSGSRPSKSDHSENETAPSLIDLRAPSKLDQPGRDHLDHNAERDDIQTVSISRRSLAPVYRGSWTSDTRTDAAQSAASGDIPIHALMPSRRSSSAAMMFQNRRAAF